MAVHMTIVELLVNHQLYTYRDIRYTVYDRLCRLYSSVLLHVLSIIWS